MRRQFKQFAFLLQDLPVRGRDKRQRCRRILPTHSTIEHMVTLEVGTDSLLKLRSGVSLSKPDTANC